MARNRIIYASQSVWCNGDVLYRVQSLGSTTTFTSEDIFELGHLDIIDVVDDVPAVALTMNTNEFGDLTTLAALAQVLPERRAMTATATSGTANLNVVNSSLVGTGVYLHGVCIPDFAIACGALPGVTLWAPVQSECSLGSLANNIDQTMYLDKVFVNNLEMGYTSGANATENFGMETDNKMWLLNDGRFVNDDKYTLISGDISNQYVDLTLGAAADIAVLAAGIGFLRKDSNGLPAVTYYNASTKIKTNIAIAVGTTAAVDTFIYHDTGTQHRIHFPSGTTLAINDRLEIIYSANAYGTGASDKYFSLLSDNTKPDKTGALRQGQVEVYIVSDTDSSFLNAWRLTGATITANMSREKLMELGHLSPYDRPLTLPVPITVSVDSTAGDLENWAKMADLHASFMAGTMDQMYLAQLMAAQTLKLVIKVFASTDEEAGGTGTARKISATSKMIGHNFWVDGVMGTYSAGNREYALKTVIVEHLKITDEAMSLDMKANATQKFTFRSTNDLYIVKGDMTIGNLTGGKKVRRMG